MKLAKLRKRFRADRAMTTISMRIPEDVIEDLKRVAPRLGFSGYQPLIRAYIGQGLRSDLERLERKPDVPALLKNLRKRGVAQEVLSSAVAESQLGKRSA